ncbi:putative glucanase B [Rosellinia necatrix]|uniref:Putative glucanase B n=1 Tax=Rosellinia necatrix TaxID=77044 RepID=A0A1S8A8P3_ROSNE|nr:putative glucanase B [Rosellinia necatrix]
MHRGPGKLGYYVSELVMLRSHVVLSLTYRWTRDDLQINGSNTEHIVSIRNDRLVVKMTNPTTQIAFKNNTGSPGAYAYVTGLDINNNNTYAFLQPDGKTLYYPASPSAPQQPLAVDCAIPLGAPGATTTVTIPQLAGGRIWFVVGSKLTFLLNPGPGIVEPSVTNETDANYKLNWGFYNKEQLFVNISYVDFVSLPIALELRNTAGATQTVQGLPADGLDRVCAQLTAQGASENPGWGKLVVKIDGKNLRALSPNAGRVGDSTLFNGYYQPYVDEAWSKYAGTDLKIDTQAEWGVVTGRVSADGLLTFPGAGTFAKPSATDIFSCSTGPFSNYPAETRVQMGAIGARLAAALNRSTLISSPNQPASVSASGAYYQTSPTNHYARILHGVNLDGRGYAFPYDDVAPSGATGPDQAGTVYDGSPELLTVTVGGPGSANKDREEGGGAIGGGDGAGDGAGDGTGDGDGDGKKDEGDAKAPFDFAALLKKIMAAIKGIFRK